MRLGYLSLLTYKTHVYTPHKGTTPSLPTAHLTRGLHPPSPQHTSQGDYTLPPHSTPHKGTTPSLPTAHLTRVLHPPSPQHTSQGDTPSLPTAHLTRGLHLPPHSTPHKGTTPSLPTAHLTRGLPSSLRASSGQLQHTGPQWGQAGGGPPWASCQPLHTPPQPGLWYALCPWGPGIGHLPHLGGEEKRRKYIEFMTWYVF